MFNENSVIVKTWVKQVKEGKCTLDDVPNLFNLREVVSKIIAESEKS